VGAKRYSSRSSRFSGLAIVLTALDRVVHHDQHRGRVVAAGPPTTCHAIRAGAREPRKHRPVLVLLTVGIRLRHVDDLHSVWSLPAPGALDDVDVGVLVVLSDSLVLHEAPSLDQD